MERLGQDSNCRPSALWTGALPLGQHNIRDRAETKRIQNFFGQVFAAYIKRGFPNHAFSFNGCLKHCTAKLECVLSIHEQNVGRLKVQTAHVCE